MKTISLAKIVLLSTIYLNAQSDVPISLASGDSIVAHDKAYYTHEKKDVNVEIIYTEDNLPFAKHTASIESPLHKDYQKYFGWTLDETLYVGLTSDYNQIANGFSTQFPNNRQINYVGGTSAVDYFSTKSWLDTLLYHETAHNYQVNVKGSAVSRSLHSIFGNGSVFGSLQLIVPNALQNSFMIEGNAILNESWHGNGGRLYSGRFKAQTILQAEAGNIVAGEVYNSKVEFPYGEIVYIQGGFYNLYLAEKYGLQKVNSYFMENSKYWVFPFFTNYSMEAAVGKDFEDTLEDYSNTYKKLAENFVKLEGEKIASSQFFSSLNNSNEEIFFLTNETGVRVPELVIFDKQTQEVKKSKESFLSGKVLKVDDKYYTQGSHHTSPIRIHQGLFSSNAFIKDGTESKMVQAYLSDGKEVYFDVVSSYSEPQLYIDGVFYDRVNSSVIVDKDDNLYYFKQEGKTRTLYKNRTPLVSFEGFYGLVSDVDSKGGVYFVANSELGSTLYCVKEKRVTRVSKADNIIEARLINDDEVLIAAISDKEYYYVKNSLISVDKKPYETKLFFEDKEYYGPYADIDKAQETQTEVDLSDNYYSFLDMHYSGTNLDIGTTSDSAIIGQLNVNFGDPLSQNSANAFISKDDSNVTIAGVGYTNSQYLLQYSATAYSVVDNDDRNDTRDSGVILGATLPFLKAGYYYGALGTTYFQDYDTANREPLSGTFTLQEFKHFGASMYINYLNMFQVYGVRERDDIIAGGMYKFKHDLPAQFYIGLGAKYSKTDSSTDFGNRGVKMAAYSLFADMDPSTIDMPSLGGSIYMKEAGYGEVSIAKVLNFSAYYFTFPISLQRESIYTKYRYYKVTDFTSVEEEVNEATLGLSFSTVLLNSMVVPVSFEYIYNDSKLVENKKTFRLLLGSSF